jgi:hypothetical protein
MTSIVTALRWVARLDGLVALILGIMYWTGSAGSLKSHIVTGFLMTITLLLMGLLGFFARIQPVMPSIAIAWAILLPYIGFAQRTTLNLGANHMVIQVIHLLIGIGAIGVVEAVGAKITREARV